MTKAQYFLNVGLSKIGRQEENKLLSFVLDVRDDVVRITNKVSVCSFTLRMRKQISHLNLHEYV